MPIVKDHLVGGRSGKGTGRKYATALNAAELNERKNRTHRSGRDSGVDKQLWVRYYMVLKIPIQSNGISRNRNCNISDS